METWEIRHEQGALVMVKVKGWTDQEAPATSLTVRRAAPVVPVSTQGGTMTPKHMPLRDLLTSV
jgi:hypothetical protein